MAANDLKNTHRLQFRFWLDVVREDEYALAEYVEDLKTSRHFAKTIRDALNLIRDLRAGKIDWLLFLFPWVYQTIYAQAEADLLAKQDAKPDAILQQLKLLEAKMEAMGAVPVGEGQKPSEVPVPKALAATSFRYVDDDEIDLDIQQAAISIHNPAFNVAISLASGNYEMLPNEILEYGIRLGRIPAHFRRDKPVSEGKPRQFNIPQLTIPDFVDDDPIDLFP